jgi:hypothetical protein
MRTFEVVVGGNDLPNDIVLIVEDLTIGKARHRIQDVLRKGFVIKSVKEVL